MYEVASRVDFCLQLPRQPRFFTVDRGHRYSRAFASVESVRGAFFGTLHGFFLVAGRPCAFFYFGRCRGRVAP